MSTQDLSQRDLHRGITTQHLEYTTPLKNNHLYTRGKAQCQSKEKGLQLGDPMITNSLGDLKGSLTIFSQNKDPKDRF